MPTQRAASPAASSNTRPRKSACSSRAASWMRSPRRRRACATAWSGWKGASSASHRASADMGNLLRVLCILQIALRFRLLRLVPRADAAPDPDRGVRLRRALETLGPIFVKFGQVLSTRRDLLPADVADELAKLQDQ